LYNRYSEIIVDYNKLNKIKEKYDHMAIRRAYAFFGVGFIYLVFQFAILARMIWIDYSWGVMEPVSYFVGLGTMIIGLSFFAAMNQEYTYNNLFDYVRKKFLRRIYLRKKFNWRKWNVLHQEVSFINTQLSLEKAQRFGCCK